MTPQGGHLVNQIQLWRGDYNDKFPRMLRGWYCGVQRHRGRNQCRIATTVKWITNLCNYG